MLLNRRRDRIPAGAVYVGRPSRWGNPYPLRREHERLGVAERYRDHLVRRLRAGTTTRRELAGLHGETLVCWCAPRPCHGHLLQAAARWAATEPAVAIKEAAWTTLPITELLRAEGARL